MNQPDDIQFTVRTVPVLDTGLGIEAGYASDAEFIRAAEAERAALDPEVRAGLDDLNAELQRRILGL